MNTILRYYCMIMPLWLFFACTQDKTERIIAPWGEIQQGQHAEETTELFDLSEIEQAGELIVLTLSGPETYYDYHGRTLGLHAMLARQLADHLGVRLRIDVCRDTAEMRAKLDAGEADLIACRMNRDSLSPGWLLAHDKPRLSAAIAQWYSPQLVDEILKEERQSLSRQRVQRRPRAQLLNGKNGIISPYDAHFRQQAQTIQWDWRLLAAQCYQESAFDPQARSWAGARGLMQIMPATAEHLGISQNQLTHPAENIAAAVRYIAELEQQFADISSKQERQNFVLAAYNGGYHHIRDAMALAEHEGGNAQRWSSVSRYVLLLSQPAYYQSSLVKYGYMRGSETVDYVEKIRKRWQLYRGVHTPSVGSNTPQKARNDKHRLKFG